MGEIALLIAIWAIECNGWIRGTVTALCTLGLVWKTIKIGMAIGSCD